MASITPPITPASDAATDAAEMAAYEQRLRFALALLAFAALNALDAATTTAFLRAGWAEGNPLAARLFALGAADAVLALKAAVVAATTALMCAAFALLPPRHRRWAVAFALALDALMVAVVANNLTPLLLLPAPR